MALAAPESSRSEMYSSSSRQFPDLSDNHKKAAIGVLVWPLNLKHEASEGRRYSSPKRAGPSLRCWCHADWGKLPLRQVTKLCLRRRRQGKMRKLCIERLDFSSQLYLGDNGKENDNYYSIPG